MLLLLIRHAKSSWKDPALPDHARPLNRRGRRTAPGVAAYLAERGWAPDHVVCSDATRTMQTWERMAPAFSGAVFDVEPGFYHAGLNAIRERLAGLEGARVVAVIGHNPGWSSAASTLSGQYIELKTCDVAVLRSQASDPSTAAWGPWELVERIRARDHDPEG